MLRRLVTPALVLAAFASTVPLVARADPPVSALSLTTGDLEVTVTLSPFALDVTRDGTSLLSTADHPLARLDATDPTGAIGPLGFAMSAQAAAQPPELGYGLFADADLRWIHATTATVGDGDASDGSISVVAATDDPTRTITVTVSTDAEGVVSIDAAPSSTAGIVWSGAAFDSDVDQRFLGFGERSDRADQDGKVVETWAEEGPFSAGSLRPYTEPALGTDWQGPPPFGPATNFPLPWFVSSRGYGLLLDSTWLNRFHLERDDSWRVATTEPALHLRVYDGPTPADVLRRATDDAQPLGRQPESADWFFGPWYQPTGANDFRESLIEGWRTQDVPVTVAQTYTHYLPCASHAANPAAERNRTDRYHSWGYKITTYVNSFVCSDHPTGAYDEGDAEGFFVKTAAGTTYPIPYVAWTKSPWSAVVDFTAPGAKAFWTGLVDDALDHGYDGWMEDFGEYVPPDARLADGSTGVASHNAYCTDYHRTSHELTWPRKGTDFAQFVRCGGIGTAPFARIVWGGDPTEDDSEADGLAAAVTQGLSMGLSGIGIWGSDIGGFHSLFTRGRTSDELLIRWLQVGAFSGIMRTQAEGYPRPDQQGQYRAEVWSPAVLPTWRALAKLRTQLFPYVRAAADQYQAEGLPLMRHLALAYPGSDAAWDPTWRYEFMFGDDLLVAPVVSMGSTSRQVWLPPGDWVDFWSAVSYDEATGSYDAAGGSPVVLGGDQVVTVDAPLDRIPLFVKAGTCLPMLPADVDTLADLDEADPSVVSLADRIDDVRRLPFAASC